MYKINASFFKKFLLDRGPFCGATGTFCFKLRMTPPMSFKVSVDRSSPAFICRSCEVTRTGHEYSSVFSENKPVAYIARNEEGK